MSVTVSGYNIRNKKDGSTFITLNLVGKLEFVQSQSTGNFRAVVSKCEIAASFPEEVAKLVVGTQMPGQIVRGQSKEPYTITDRQTGEQLVMTHRWSYLPEGATVPVEEPVLEETEEEAA